MQDGYRINFYCDWWYEDGTLWETFLVAYGVARVKDASMAANLEIYSDFPQWNINFIRVAQN